MTLINKQNYKIKNVFKNILYRNYAVLYLTFTNANKTYNSKASKVEGKYYKYCISTADLSIAKIVLPHPYSMYRVT